MVVGGGPAGCAAAATACAEGADVVIYAGPAASARPHESLPPGAAHLVDEIFAPGAWEPRDHLPAYANASRWGSPELETADFVFNPFGHGWHLDRPAFDRALLESVAANGIRVVHDRSATQPDAPFVIDATGRWPGSRGHAALAGAASTGSSPSGAPTPWKRRPSRP